jgi:hypothetical protein
MDNIYKYHGLPNNIISILVHNSSWSFGNHYSRSLRSRSSYLPHIILRLMDKQKGLIKSWSNIYIVLSTTIKTIEQSCYHLPSLRITISSKDLLSRPHSLPIMGTIQSLISFTSTMWKIQQPKTLLFNFLRFIQRWRINFLKLKTDKRIIQISLEKRILWSTLKIRYGYFAIISRSFAHVINVTSVVLDPSRLISKSML